MGTRGPGVAAGNKSGNRPTQLSLDIRAARETARNCGIDPDRFLAKCESAPYESGLRVDSLPEHMLLLAAHHPRASPVLLSGLVRYCKYNAMKNVASLAIKNPNFDTDQLISLIREGREYILAPNGHKSEGGLWWQYTEGLRNPALPLWMLENVNNRRTLCEICNCEAIEDLMR